MRGLWVSRVGLAAEKGRRIPLARGRESRRIEADADVMEMVPQPGAGK